MKTVDKPPQPSVYKLPEMAALSQWRRKRLKAGLRRHLLLRRWVRIVTCTFWVSLNALAIVDILDSLSFLTTHGAVWLYLLLGGATAVTGFVSLPWFLTQVTDLTQASYFRDRLRNRAGRPYYCALCGYDLRRGRSKQCPECGWMLDIKPKTVRDRPGPAALPPWEQFQRISLQVFFVIVIISTFVD